VSSSAASAAGPAAAPWPAPPAPGPVRAEVRLPGSKSMTNRALVIAALAEGPTVIRGPLRARDTELMAGALRALGVVVDDLVDGVADGALGSGRVAAGHWRVQPRPLRGPADVDCGLAGTVMRFLLPVAALARGEVRLDGDPRARERPMRPLLSAVRALGADVQDSGRGGLPLLVRGRGALRGGSVSLDASASSQFVSALLLAGPRFDAGVVVRQAGPPVPSLPHIAMTLAMLAQAGAEVAEPAPATWTVRPGPLQGGDVLIEPDLSNAAPFLAAALVTGGRVRVPGWPVTSTQPGMALPALLEGMGAGCTQDGSGLTVTGGGSIHGIEADLRDVPELTTVVAALAALADSPSTLSGVAHLRGQESDRLAATAAELNALGGDVTETSDGLVIRPRPLHGGTFATYDDHRLATAAAVIGLAVPGVLVQNVATTAKTLPDFTTLWQRMLEGGR